MLLIAHFSLVKKMCNLFICELFWCILFIEMWIWSHNKKIECIFFTVDFISWMDFKIITIIMKLIVLVLCSLFILYDWTLELLRAWVTISDIIHSFAFSNYKIHKVLICGFISLILSTKERSNDSKTIKKNTRIVELNFQDNRRMYLFQQAQSVW